MLLRSLRCTARETGTNLVNRSVGLAIYNLRSDVFFSFFGKKGKKIRQVNVSCPPSPPLNIREGGYDRRLGYLNNLNHGLSSSEINSLTGLPYG